MNPLPPLSLPALLAASLGFAPELLAQDDPTPDFDESQGPIFLALPPNFLDARAGTLRVIPIGEDPLPVAGYEKSPVNGAFVQSEDGEFRLQLGGYTQIRYNANFRDAPQAPPVDMEFGNDDRTRGYSLARTRFFFEGKYTDDFAFHFRTNTDSEGETELLVAWGQWRIDENWSLRFGKQFIPLSREDWMFAQDLLTIEFSPNDFTYAIGPSLGGFLHYSGEEHRFWFSLHNGAYGGRESFPSPETDAAGTVRWEWALAGDDWSVWDDLVGRPGRAHGILLGTSAAYQHRTQETGAMELRTGAQANVDLSFSGDGYHAMVAGSATWVDMEAVDSFTRYGLLAQAGVFVADKQQIYGQYNFLSPGDQPGDLENFDSIALGYSFFPFDWTNRWKFSAEVGHLFGSLNQTVVGPSGALGWLPSDEDDQTYLKFQAQIGF